MQNRKWLATTAVSVTMAAVSSVRATTGVASTLYSFGSTGDGVNPSGALILSGTNLYGQTKSGGGAGFGTLFQYNLSTGTETSLYSFKGSGDANNNNGNNAPALFGGIFYSVTNEGGSFNLGTDFTFTPGSSTATVVHSFGSGSTQDGIYPIGSFISSGSNLYGVTTTSSATGGDGIIYSVNPTTQSEVILHRFTGSGNTAQIPTGSLTQVGTLMYGVARTGGTSSSGILYSFNASNSAFNAAYTFNSNGLSTDGFNPIGNVIASGSMIYGATQTGGASGYGTVFSFNTSNNTESVLYSFAGGADGDYPLGSLVQSGNYLYGMTGQDGPLGSGTVYAFNLQTGVETVVAGLSSQGIGSLTLSGNTLYGVTSGGANGKGSIISVSTIPAPEPAGIAAMAVGLLALGRRRRTASS